MSDQHFTLYYLVIALAIGLLIGVERGWEARHEQEGSRVAGIRTYGLIGLLGGVLALLSERIGPMVFGLAFIAVAGTLTVAYIFNPRNGNHHVGITSLIAGLITFVLGALAAMSEVVIASASAIVTALILSYKPLLHRWVSALEEHEIHAVIKLLLISAVLLPVLPNQSFGPWSALNPYIIWWMVVLIALISFVGYFAIKIIGTRRGIIFTGLFGGLVSSTALTLDFSRMARRNTGASPILSTGVLLACGTMFPRMLLVASILNTRLLPALLVPVMVMAVFTYLPALIYTMSQSSRRVETASPLNNPLELKTAVTFGLFLALIMLLSKILQEFFGDMGIMVLAAASGLTDVDAITLSLAKMSSEDLALRITAMSIVIAAAVNSLTKGGISAVVGGREIGFRVGLPLLATALAGPITTWFWVW